MDFSEKTSFPKDPFFRTRKLGPASFLRLFSCRASSGCLVHFLHSRAVSASSFGLHSLGGSLKGCLIKGCLSSTKIPKVGIPKAGIPKVGIPKTGIPKVGKTHTETLPETEIPKSGIPKTGIPKARIPKLGIPKTSRFTAPLIQTPLRLPLTSRFFQAVLQGVAFTGVQVLR